MPRRRSAGERKHSPHDHRCHAIFLPTTIARSPAMKRSSSKRLKQSLFQNVQNCYPIHISKIYFLFPLFYSTRKDSLVCVLRLLLWYKIVELFINVRLHTRHSLLLSIMKQSSKVISKLCII